MRSLASLHLSTSRKDIAKKAQHVHTIIREAPLPVRIFGAQASNSSKGEGQAQIAVDSFVVYVSLSKAKGNARHQIHQGLTSSEGVKKVHFSRQTLKNSKYRGRHPSKPVPKMNGRFALQRSTGWIRTPQRA